MIDKKLFGSLFQVGDVFDSGGSPSRSNAARLELLAIEEACVRYKSLKNRKQNRKPGEFTYSYLDVVLNGFDQIDPKSIQPTIQKVFLAAGLKEDFFTENYVYGFAKEIRKRLAGLLHPFLSSGEMLDSTLENRSNTVQEMLLDGAGAVLLEGERMRVSVDRQERSAEAVRQCKRIHGVLCFGCGFDFKATYGSIGADYIHAHHLNPLSTRTGTHVVNPQMDLIPLCPNCHAMVHRASPMLTIIELKHRIATAKESGSIA